MGIKFNSITELATGLLASHKIAYTTGAITRLLRLDTLADWILQTYTGFTQSGSGASSRTSQDKMRERVSVKDFGAAGDNTTDDQSGIDAADAAVSTGGELWFNRGRYVVGSTITKSGASDWVGIRGVQTSDRTVTYGSVLVLGFDGAIVTLPTTGDISVMYAGFRGLNFYSPGVATYAAGVAIKSNGNVRETVIEDGEINGFNIGIQGPHAERYANRLFLHNCKYGFFDNGSSDCWFTEVHAGSGLSAPAGTSGGAGFFYAAGNNSTWTACRGQVQLGGYGYDLRSSARLTLNGGYADASETAGVRIVNCNEVDLIGMRIYDNGTTGTNGDGVIIEALSDTFTADDTTDEITITSGNASLYWSANHTIVQFSNSGGALPTGLSADTEYYLIAGSAAGKFKVAANYADAVAGTEIDITGAGSGTNSILGVCRDIRIIGGAIFDRNTGAADEKQDVGIKFVKTQLNSAAKGIIKNVTLTGVDLSRLTTTLENQNEVLNLRVSNCPGIRTDPYVLARSGAAVSVGAVTTEATLATITLPGKALGENGFVRISASFTFTNGANDKTTRIKFGGTVVNGIVHTTVTTYRAEVQVINRNATNSQVGAAASSSAPQFGTIAAALPTASVDTTADVTILITGQKEVDSETLTLESYVVEVFPG
jgi:hypothetical protein